MAYKKITFEQWEETYKPIQNTVSNREEYNGWMFETYDEDEQFVKETAQKNPNVVWTVLTGTDEGDVLVQGFHYVNRLCYFITEIPFDDRDEIEVYLDED